MIQKEYERKNNSSLRFAGFVDKAYKNIYLSIFLIALVTIFIVNTIAFVLGINSLATGMITGVILGLTLRDAITNIHTRVLYNTALKTLNEVDGVDENEVKIIKTWFKKDSFCVQYEYANAV